MDNAAIFSPFLGMMVLTLVVWLWMFVHRVSYFKANKIDPQSVSDSSIPFPNAPPRVVNSSNNFKNLFELPVLFYAICLYLYVNGTVDQLYLICAYSFLVFRALHSAIHCTSNIVMARFVAYALASLALWTMIVRAALGVFAA